MIGIKPYNTVNMLEEIQKYRALEFCEADRLKINSSRYLNYNGIFQGCLCATFSRLRTVNFRDERHSTGNRVSGTIIVLYDDRWRLPLW